MCVCFGRVSLHCLNFCTPGITFVQFPIVAWELHRDGIIMVNVWLKFSGGGGMVTPSKPPSLYEQLSPLPTPCFKMFLERSLNEPPPPHFKHLSLLHPSPSTTPSPPIKMLIIHWGIVLFMVLTICQQYLSCFCIHQEMMVDRTEIVLYTQEWSVYLQHFYVNYEKSTSKRECSWTFLHCLKRSHWSFRPRVASDNLFLWNLKCLTKYFVSFKKYKWSPFFNLKKSFDPPFDLRKSTWSLPPIFGRLPPGKKWHFPKSNERLSRIFI